MRVCLSLTLIFALNVSVFFFPCLQFFLSNNCGNCCLMPSCTVVTNVGTPSKRNKHDFHARSSHDLRARSTKPTTTPHSSPRAPTNKNTAASPTAKRLSASTSHLAAGLTKRGHGGSKAGTGPGVGQSVHDLRANRALHTNGKVPSLLKKRKMV